MDIMTYRDHCLSKKGVTEETPFGPDTLVFKVVGKMFSATSLNAEEFRCNVKCDPIYAEEQRDEYPDIIPGWHMNKKHWNTLYCERELDDKKIKELIDDSYNLVVSKLTKKQKEELEQI